MIKKKTVLANSAQRQFLSSPAKYALFVSGRGGGKTWSGAMYCCQQMARYPGVTGLALANNPRQCNEVIVKSLKRQLDILKWPYVWGRNPAWYRSKFTSHVGILSLANGSQILVKSACAYDSVLRGVDAGFIWLDEAREMAPEVFDVASACLRGQKNASYQVRVTTTPAGFDWIYRKFADENTRLNDSVIIHSTTAENARNLPPSFEQDLLGLYGKNYALQEVSGQFVSLNEGAVFEFDRKKHVRPINPDRNAQSISFAMDFNVSPLIGIVMQIDRRARTCMVIDEIVIPSGGQTARCCEEFVRRYQGPWVCEFVGDQAGAHGDTRTTTNDIDIMRQQVRKAFPRFMDMNDNRRHRIINRVNCINALLNPAIGGPKLLVSPKCIQLIKDLEQLTWKPGTKEIDKEDQSLSHAADALGYMVERALPLQVGQVLSGWNDDKPIARHL